MDRPTRNAIERATQRARGILEEDFRAQLEGSFDILPTGHVATTAGLHLSDRQIYQRQTIVAAIDRKRNAGLAPREAVGDYVRDTAFTTINRFVALKLLEARGLLQECISKGPQSSGYVEFCGLAPDVALLPGDAGYRLFIESLFDELSTEVKVLFDRRDPASVLWPRRQAFEGLLDVLNAPELAGVWREDETIGWVYQYFNGADERKKMREESQAPRNSRELAIRNQFFTPRYVVQFLVDNTLGRMWLEMYGQDDPLGQSLEYFVRPADEPLPARSKKDPRDLKILDPACGSGHFLLYSYDVLARMYEEAWEAADGSPASQISGRTLQADYPSLHALRAAVPTLIIENNLYGVEIDARCAQIAALALWLRAQRSFQDLRLSAADRPRINRTHIVIAEPMPGDRTLAAAFAAQLDQPFLRTLFERMVAEMQLAGELGVLLQTEKSLAEDISRARRQYQAQQEKPELFPNLRPTTDQFQLDLSGVTDDGVFHEAEGILLAALAEFAAVGEGDPRRRLFAGDAAQGISLIDVVRMRFDVIVMNPPFGQGSAPSASRLKGAYENSSRDIFQCFVERALELVHSHGLVGVLSARTGFFMGDSESWRRSVIWPNTLRCFADLGLGVLDDALVEVAGYTVEKGSTKSGLVHVGRLLRSRDKQSALQEYVASVASATTGPDAFAVEQSLVANTPGAVFGYWAPRAFLQRYAVDAGFGQAVARVRQGLATADDFRFVRLRWEVEEARTGLRLAWAPFSKGGEYSPPFDDIHLVVNWNCDGRELRSLPSARVQNDRYFGKPGATYSVRTASAFAAKILPSGCVFSHMAQSWFSEDRDLLIRSVMYFLARVPQAYLEINVGGGDVSTSGSVARRYTTAVVESTPASVVADLDYPGLPLDAQAILRLRAWDLAEDETSVFFAGIRNLGNVPDITQLAELVAAGRSRLVSEALAATYRIDAAVQAAWGLTANEATFVEEEIGPHPLSYAGVASEEEVARLLRLDTESLVAEATRRCGPARWLTKKSYFADRRTELICHTLGCNPAQVEAVAARLPDVTGAAKDVLSYAFGIAIGRFGRSVGVDFVESFVVDPFAELPVTPPAASGRIEAGAFLVDDGGHPLDVELAVKKTLSALTGASSNGFIPSLESAIGSSIREYMCRNFFPDHIARYSKSRRAAPPYWQLGVASGRYSVWCYAQRMTSDSLFALSRDLVAPKLELEERRRVNLVQEVGPNPTARQRAEIAAQDAIVDELRAFAEEVRRVAPLWDPDLDDGIVLVSSALWRLVPHRAWQKELHSRWNELVAGKYDWSHLAMHLWPERVVPKCADDRSLAIAHGLEDVFWAESAAGKWSRRARPTKSTEDLVAEHSNPAAKAALTSMLEAPGTAGRGRGRKGTRGAP